MKQLNKIISLTLCLIVLGALSNVVYGQTITGKIVDNEKKPIDGATVILQAIDSSYLGAAISDIDGIFSINKQPDKYRLIIQHISYNTKQIVTERLDVGTIQMESQILAVDEVIIRADRPFVRIENGRLNYNLSQLAEGKVVNNVYEALAKLPGIQPTKDGLSLAGAGNVTIVINGKPTTMNAQQLETLLRNTPISRVDKTEVMYSAPPQYHARGAVINVILKRSNEDSLQGEMSANYTNRYFNSGGVNGNFRISTPKIALDIMYGARDVKNLEYMNVYSRHTLNGRVEDINQNNKLSSKYLDHNLRTAFEYNFNSKSNINLSYTGNFNPNQLNKSQTTGNHQTSNTDKHIETQMNNVSLQYHGASGLDIGGDYTHYRSDNQQKLSVDYLNSNHSSLSLHGSQKISQYSIYADRSHKLNKNWDFGYGVSYKFAKDTDYQTYDQVVGDIHTENSSSNLKEHTVNFYASAGKNYKSGTSFSISATGEYYAIGDYNKWAIHPQATLAYQKTPEHTFQLSLSTDKTYPSYWNMQSSVSYIDGYTELWGTSGLRPMTTYSLNGSYVLKRRYIFNLYLMHTSDYFAQSAYQSTDRLALIYKNLNWDYIQLIGANVIIPFKIGNWLDSRLTLDGMQMHQRCDDFFDISFDRRKWMFSGSLDNTLKVNNNLAFEVSGNIQTPTIQGTFDVKSSFNLTAGVKWNLAAGKMILTARCSDIFGTSMPNLNIRFMQQYLDMNNAFYSRSFNINFTYKFGGYRAKEKKPIDTSRFGH